MEGCACPFAHRQDFLLGSVDSGRRPLLSVQTERHRGWGGWCCAVGTGKGRGGIPFGEGRACPFAHRARLHEIVFGTARARREGHPTHLPCAETGRAGDGTCERRGGCEGGTRARRGLARAWAAVSSHMPSGPAIPNASEAGTSSHAHESASACVHAQQRVGDGGGHGGGQGWSRAAGPAPLVRAGSSWRCVGRRSEAASCVPRTLASR